MEDFSNWPNAAAVGWTIAAQKVSTSDKGGLKISNGTTHDVAMKTLVQHNNTEEEQWIACAELAIALSHALPSVNTPLEKAVLSAFYAAANALYDGVVTINNPEFPGPLEECGKSAKQAAIYQRAVANIAKWA